MASVRLSEIRKAFRETQILHGVSLEVGRGEVLREGARVGTSHRPLGLLLAVRHLVAVVDPHLHADLAKRRLRLGKTVIDIGAKRCVACWR